MSSDTDDVDIETSQGRLSIPTIQRTLAKTQLARQKETSPKRTYKPFILNNLHKHKRSYFLRLGYDAVNPLI